MTCKPNKRKDWYRKARSRNKFISKLLFGEINKESAYALWQGSAIGSAINAAVLKEWEEVLDNQHKKLINKKNWRARASGALREVLP